MPIDPSIPLRVERPRFIGPAELISLRNLRTQAESAELALAEARRKREQEIALRDLLSRPGAVDEATGELSGEGLAGISRTDPLLGMQLRREQRVALSELNKHLREQTKFQAEQAKLQTDLTKSVLQKAVAAHDFAVAGGAAPKGEVAGNAFRNAYATALAELKRSGALASAGISEEEIAQAEQIPWDVDRARAWVATPEQAMEAAQYAPETPANVPLSQVGQEQAPQGIVQPEGATTFAADMTVPQPRQIPETAIEPQVVSAPHPVETPDDLRRRARALEARGGKVNYERAKDLRSQADKMDERIFKEREKRKLVGGVPGVVYDESSGEYLRNGKPISAEEVESIAARIRRAGASSITIGGMTPENAAKTELLNQGMADMAELKEMIFKPDGSVDRDVVLGMSVPGFAGAPGTDSRIAYSLIYNAVEAKLRAESGAAVPETEVKRMAARFIPSPLDNDETIRSKVRRMEAFLRGSFARIKGAGEPSTPVEKTTKPPSGQGTRKPQPLTEDEKKELERLRQWQRERAR
jgi:hypothetical protein